MCDYCRWLDPDPFLAASSGDHATRCEVHVAGYELFVDAMYPIEYIYIVYDMYTFTYITFTYIYTYTYTYVYTVYIYVFMLLRSKS